MYPRAWKRFSEVRYRRTTRNHAFGGYVSPRNVATMGANIPAGAWGREKKEMSNQPNLRAGIETAHGLDRYPALFVFVERVMTTGGPLAVGKEE